MSEQIFPSLSRFDRSAIRSFFTLPSHLTTDPNAKSFKIFSKPLPESLLSLGSISKDNTLYYIIWLSNPEELLPEDRLDFSFRDFSFYGLPPYVLIRKSQG